MDIFDKLDKILEQPHWTQSRVAEEMKVAQSSVNRWSQRQSEPRGNLRDAIAEIYAGIFGDDQPIPAGVIEVPLVSWVSAGALTKDDVAQEAIGRILVADLPPGDWIALTVTGTSMNRISPPDSTIFVNRRDRQLVSNACYVIDDGEGNATYKRYRNNPMRFEPVSTDPSHEPIFPDNDPTVVGRVGLSQIRM
jgi:SOS-response transcriptional repressor LexA